MDTMDDTPADTAPATGELEVRTTTSADLAQLVRLNEAAFGYTSPEGVVGPWIESYARPYSQAAVVDGQLVGAAAAFEMELTLPGGATAVCPGVTSVAVLPTHRRQGVLKKLMWRQLAEMRRGGAPIAALTASEATIYERFGYGQATEYAKITINTTRAEFRTPVGPGHMRLVDSSEARVLLPAIHDAKRSVRHGMTSRPEEMWRSFFDDHESDRDGSSALFHVIHLDGNDQPDGYVSYRVEEVATATGLTNIVHVQHVVGLRPAVEIDLWRFVCSLDLSREVRGMIPVNDPLRRALVDTRALAVTGVTDHLWLRIIDFAGVLTARRYERDGEIVVGAVDWEFTGNTGQFRLQIEGGNATVSRTEDKPVAMADIAAWSALVLGGVDATHLALAGRVQGDPMAINRFFRTSHEPWCDVDF